MTRDDAAAALPDGSVDLVVCNPPFHLGAAVVTTAADRLFAAAGRVLRPGGELWTVYNSALRHKPTLTRLVGSDARGRPDAEVHGHGLHPPLTRGGLWSVHKSYRAAARDGRASCPPAIEKDRNFSRISAVVTQAMDRRQR